MLARPAFKEQVIRTMATAYEADLLHAAHPGQPEIHSFTSRRSTVMGTRGMVAASQPLAAEAGMRILQQGGNAADAAVAVAAALNVTEPNMTGIGGDAFALYYSAKDRTVSAIMGNGHSPGNLTLEAVREKGIKGTELPPYSPLCITVPGAAALWEDLVKEHGSKSMQDVLQPAIELAEGGFPVSPITARLWAGHREQLLQGGGYTFLNEDKSTPKYGQLFRNPDLAQTFRTLAEQGAQAGFYKGRIADAIVEEVQSRGGLLTHDDLASHRSLFTRPITTSYRGLRVHEIPPPTQGMAALMAFNSLELDEQLRERRWGSAEHLHSAIEAMRLAFSDTLAYCADPQSVNVPIDDLLSKQYAKQRRAKLFKPDKAAEIHPGDPSLDFSSDERRPGGDTVYFCTADGQGNACSFINSNYMGFGTGIVPQGCGFSLQNRGQGFIIDPKHPNCIGPHKRPYHTIIPGMVTDANGELFAAFGVMGGFMQPQGHLQVLSNMVDFGMDPQTALDAPRFALGGVDSVEGPSCVSQSSVLLEEGFEDGVSKQLRQLGHHVESPLSRGARQVFGRGQIIRRNPKTGLLAGGSDPRADGQVLGW
ncbi:hypothetical protein WJX73_007818 [Symbiochloris irregularis]|uniref:Gamma-glutamyltransferase n=1 Tax=Symbiochloris irregularis TaxID=706552 RepID=A0AAW1NIV8_9CHLO